MAWWLGKKIIIKKSNDLNYSFDVREFDNLITYLIISILIGGRIGYVLFYNFEYYSSNFVEIFKIWNGGMSFHGALLGIIIGTYLFASKKNISTFFLLDIIACVSPIGIFFGRLANFINGELIGKATNASWGIIFPLVDQVPRHPSQLYEALLEGMVLFILMNLIVMKKNYKIGLCSSMFLIFYGLLRIISEFFREPDAQIGYLFNLASTGTILSVVMFLVGITLYLIRKNEI